MKRILPVLRGFLFIIILLVIVLSVQQVLSVDSERIYENVHGFYRERPGSLDGVFIGSSNVHSFWEPVFGWKQSGITVWNLSVDQMPMKAIKYYIIEARKTQPDALVMINLNSFRKETATPEIRQIHYAVDYCPFSINKIRMISALNSGPEHGFSDLVESFFPLIRFHSRWSDLKQWSFSNSSLRFKSSIAYSVYQTTSVDLSGKLTYYGAPETPPDDVLAVFSDLLLYCQKNHISVLFVKVPQVMSKEEQGRLNYLESMAAAAGFPCLDLFENMDSLDLDLGSDFYNSGHTNVHGSFKISNCLGQYLVQNYRFPDKRGLSEYAGWDREAERYMDYLKPNIFPFEPDHPERADIAAPGLNAPAVDGRNVLVSWKPSDGADGFEVYRNDQTEWVLIADLPAGARTLRDQVPKPSVSYSYTVVPYRLEGGKKQYGRFDVHGVSLTVAEN